MVRVIPQSARDRVAWLSPGMMILFGAILFFIPVPPTSLIGIVLMFAGALLWLVNYLGGSAEESGSSDAGTEDAEAT
jgi:drug/metabolite transporter (DMT)-like permease